MYISILIQPNRFFDVIASNFIVFTKQISAQAAKTNVHTSQVNWIVGPGGPMKMKGKLAYKTSLQCIVKW